MVATQFNKMPSSLCAMSVRDNDVYLIILNKNKSNSKIRESFFIEKKYIECARSREITQIIIDVKDIMRLHKGRWLV